MEFEFSRSQKNKRKQTTSHTSSDNATGAPTELSAILALIFNQLNFRLQISVYLNLLRSLDDSRISLLILLLYYRSYRLIDLSSPSQPLAIQDKNEKTWLIRTRNISEMLQKMKMMLLYKDQEARPLLVQSAENNGEAQSGRSPGPGRR